MVICCGLVMALSRKRDMPGEIHCQRCASLAVTKNGTIRGEQRYYCKDCHYNFVNKPRRGRPAAQKALAVLLYNLGLSMTSIGRLFELSPTAVLKWVHSFAESHATKPEPPEHGVVVVELDEMWHYLKKNPTNSGSGKLIVVIQASWLTGNVAIVTKAP